MIDWNLIEHIIKNLRYPLSFFYLLNKNYRIESIFNEYDYICSIFIKHHLELFINYPMEILLNKEVKNKMINIFFDKLKKVLYFSKIYFKLKNSIKSPYKYNNSYNFLINLERNQKIFNSYFNSNNNFPIYAKYYETILNNDNTILSIIKELMYKSVKLFGIKFYINLGINIMSNIDFDYLKPKEKLAYINEFHIKTQKILEITIKNLYNYINDKQVINNIINYKKININLFEMIIDF